MADRIIVSGDEIDLFFDEDINFNMKVNTLGDISNRNSSNSNSILIPRTSKNERILGFVGLMGNTSNTPYTSLRCDYIRGGTYVVTNGYLQVIETLEDKYRIVIHDGIIDFSVLLGNKTLASLDFTPENHILDIASFEASFGNRDGYIYAMGDFGRNTPGGIDIEGVGVSVFAHTVWDRIFTEAGLTYTGDFFTTNTDWKELLLPPARGHTIIESEAIETDIGIGNTGVISDNTDYGTYTVKEYAHGYNQFITHNGAARFAYTITYSQVNTRVRWKLLVNDVVKKTIDLPYVATASPVIGDVTIQVAFGDIVTIELTVDNPVPIGPPSPTYFTHNFSTSTSIRTFTIAGGTFIEVNDYITTGLLQKDFVKDILQRYGLIMLRNAINPNEYEFISMDALLGDRTNNIDWTEKLNIIQREKYQNSYAQLNKADYSYLSGVVPFLTGELQVINSNAPARKTIITAPYEVPESSLVVLNGIRFYSFPIWEFNDDTSEWENIETTPKLMRLKLDSTDASFTLFGSAPHVINVDIPYLSLDNMSYQHFLDTYYANFNLLLNSYKEVSVDLDLDIVDYKLIDFSKLIYLRQTGRYYYIDSVRIKSKGATAKLIEIRNFTA